MAEWHDRGDKTLTRIKRAQERLQRTLPVHTHLANPDGPRKPKGNTTKTRKGMAITLKGSKK